MDDHLIIFVIGIILLLSLHTTYAQENLIPLDTIELQGKQVIIYQNNIWQELPAENPLLADARSADTLDIFTRNWERSSIYAYSSNGLGHTIPEAILLVLADDDRKFELPYYGRILSGYGWRGSRSHDGLDLDLEKGQPIKAAFDGKVRYAQYHHNGYGKLVIIRHFNGLETYYAHLSTIFVQPDQMVKAGQIIGAGGSTGSTYHGPHLHFETRWYDLPFDPLSIIDYENECLVADTVVLTPEDFKPSQPAKAARNLQPLAQQNPYSSAPLPVDTATVSRESQEEAAPETYTIRKGDSLYKIARNCNTTVKKLCEINDIDPNSVLKIGKKIKLN
ncbi:MAG TPA: peptidoglycan DD-metalloendopeptidase family protein [Bacteroidales bacterium]|nr:peptidoglycan DD-metalloendopeptidase family protein [Bacteroidales bacterium]